MATMSKKKENNFRESKKRDAENRKQRQFTFVTDISVLAVWASLVTIFPFIFIAGTTNREATMHTSNKWLSTRRRRRTHVVSTNLARPP